MIPEPIIWLISTLIISIVIVLYGTPKLVEVAKHKHLFDDPKENRKIHDNKVPNIGGVVILISILLAFCITPYATEILGFQYLIASLLILFIVGVKDDLLLISPLKKIIAQLLVATLMIFGAEITINNFSGIFGVYELPTTVSIIITYLFYVVMMNAVNLIDGVDGLASSIILLVTVFFGVWFLYAELYPQAILSCTIGAAYGSFLYFNWSPATIFMGDTGSLVGGLFLAYLGLNFLNSGIEFYGIVSWQWSFPVILLALFIVPLYDTLRIFILRFINGKSVFIADDNHVHHQLIKEDFSHSQTTLFIVIINLFVVGVTIALTNYLTINQLLFTLAFLAVILLPTNNTKRKIIAHFHIILKEK